MYLQYFQLKIETIIYKCAIKWSEPQKNISTLNICEIQCIIILLLTSWGQQTENCIARGKERKCERARERD